MNKLKYPKIAEYNLGEHIAKYSHIGEEKGKDNSVIFDYIAELPDYIGDNYKTILVLNHNLKSVEYSDLVNYKKELKKYIEKEIAEIPDSPYTECTDNQYKNSNGDILVKLGGYFYNNEYWLSMLPFGLKSTEAYKKACEVYTIKSEDETEYTNFEVISEFDDETYVDLYSIWNDDSKEPTEDDYIYDLKAIDIWETAVTVYNNLSLYCTNDNIWTLSDDIKSVDTYKIFNALSTGDIFNYTVKNQESSITKYSNIPATKWPEYIPISNNDYISDKYPIYNENNYRSFLIDLSEESSRIRNILPNDTSVFLDGVLLAVEPADKKTNYADLVLENSSKYIMLPGDNFSNLTYYGKMRTLGDGTDKERGSLSFISNSGNYSFNKDNNNQIDDYNLRPLYNSKTLIDLGPEQIFSISGTSPLYLDNMYMLDNNKYITDLFNYTVSFTDTLPKYELFYDINCVKYSTTKENIENIKKDSSLNNIHYFNNHLFSGYIPPIYNEDNKWKNSVEENSIILTGDNTVNGNTYFWVRLESYSIPQQGYIDSEGIEIINEPQNIINIRLANDINDSIWSSWTVSASDYYSNNRPILSYHNNIGHYQSYLIELSPGVSIELLGAGIIKDSEDINISSATSRIENIIILNNTIEITDTVSKTRLYLLNEDPDNDFKGFSGINIYGINDSSNTINKINIELEHALLMRSIIKENEI